MDSLLVITTFIASLIMISAGIVGIVYRRNLVAILISIEVILNAINLDFILFSRLKSSHIQMMDGQTFALFNILIAAVEITVGLAIIFAIRNALKTSDIDKLSNIKE
ncbi:MAG: NADH-quinone oxidoreductase subunit NuoK [bacterium]